MAGFLSRLFGGKTPPPAPVAEEYKGFTITPRPIQAGGEYRVGATIEKDGRLHEMIRADTLRDQDACAEASVLKAKQVIDQQGDRLFG
ncbi:HlyU family transcriptional regulator [Jannaschia sp. 2305UL9-9]|uniref:HlyU family transcriptional regulator n=1 Tax=Jannaschia sp. 2305UL9-9 TaxID=3121638 RepID=UPI00352857A8